MPYYRITIWLRDQKKPIQGIRQYEQKNIDLVTNMARAKAKKHYGDLNVIDIEAAMLSSHSTAAKKYQEEEEKKRKNS